MSAISETYSRVHNILGQQVKRDMIITNKNGK